MKKKLNRSGMKEATAKVDNTIYMKEMEILDQENSGRSIKDPEPMLYDSTAYDFLSKLYNRDDKTNKDTELAQIYLKKIGRYQTKDGKPGIIDGLYGVETKKAIERYTMQYSPKHMWSLVKGKYDSMFE